MGANKKYVPCILKYVRHISKYLRHIFLPLKTRLKTAPKMRTKTALPLRRTQPCRENRDKAGIFAAHAAAHGRKRQKSYDYANFCRMYAKKALQHIVY